MSDLVRRLDELHAELRDCEDQLRALPKVLARKEAEQVRRETDQKAAREAHKKFRAETDRKELDLKTNDKRLVDLKVKLNQCRNTDEFTAIQKEMTAFQTANAALEEEIFTRINETDETTARLAAADEAIAAAALELAKVREQGKYSTDKLTRRGEDLKSRIAELEPHLEADLVMEYRRSLKLKGEPGFAACDESGNCQRCFIEQSLQAIGEIRGGRVRRCVSCNSLLYRAVAAAAEADA
jgi:predicted  nucleic acid-binding Zn-ribbon protein